MDGGACRAAKRRRWSGGLALGVLGALVHLAIHNVFDNLYVQGIYLQVALWLGLIIPLTGHGAHETTLHVPGD